MHIYFESPMIKFSHDIKITIIALCNKKLFFFFFVFLCSYLGFLFLFFSENNVFFNLFRKIPTLSELEQKYKYGKQR